jgi:hypothetical protein
MGLFANFWTTHSVPQSDSWCGPSGSTVFRCIDDFVGIDDWKKQVQDGEREWQKYPEAKRASWKERHLPPVLFSS